LYIAVFSCLLSCNTQKIIDKPILFDEERKQLSLNYLSERYGLQQEEPSIIPKMIVLHWTAIPTFEKSFEAFYESNLTTGRSDIKSAGALNVSSHFLVDLDGTIYRLMPETTMARHVIGLANIWLVNYLANKYAISYLIGHQEYTNFEGHDLWLEQDEGYRTKKTDPGMSFLAKVKEATTQHNFKPTPLPK